VNELAQHKTAMRNTSGWYFLVLAGAVAAILYYGFRPGRGDVELFFFSKDSTAIVSEFRRIPLSGSVETRVEMLMREITLGPMNHQNQPLFASKASLRSVLERNGRLHIDISIQDLAAQRLGMVKIRQAIAKSISASIPGAPPIFLYIDGYRIE
jgi:hypothetical protein